MARDLKILNEPAREPVTAKEAKDYAKIDYSTEDAIVDLMIRAARKQIEEFTGVGLGLQKVQYTFPSQCNETQTLPRRPFSETVSITYQSCRLSTVQNVLTDTDSWEITGDSFTGEKGTYDIVYKSGFTEVPADLKLAVLIQVAYDYENRGNQDAAGMCKQAKEKCKPYKLNLWGI